MESPNPAALPCSACGERERPGDAPHRRGRCRRCYENWVRERPVGLGAFCNGCGERRRECLRFFELRASWVVLCHNCSARADALKEQPHSIAGLRMRLLRDRRCGDRRAESVGARAKRLLHERREGDRRTSERNILDATEFAEMVIELEAEFADEKEHVDDWDGPITAVRALVDPRDL